MRIGSPSSGSLGVEGEWTLFDRFGGRRRRFFRRIPRSASCIWMNPRTGSSQRMKSHYLLVVSLVALACVPASAQPQSSAQAAITESPPKLTKFDLDFPGGTPADLVTAIQKATGRPLNVVILEQDANRRLPPLKMSGVDAAQLFDALSETSLRMALINGHYQQTRFGFQTRGRPSDESIWFFRIEEMPPPPPSSRFFQLAPYLGRGLTVDDITTAIQTAWKMRGDVAPPKISFHKETNLLIAVGDPMSLDTIQQVLSALDGPKPADEAKPADKKQ